MINQTAYNLGANRSVIRDLFEYGRSRAAVVGEENIFDYSLGISQAQVSRLEKGAIAQMRKSISVS